MIRIIVRTDDAQMMAHVGGSVESTYRTFDCDLPELEQFLRATQPYVQKQIIGTEIVGGDR